LDAAARTAAVKGAADALRQRYVYPDVGERAAQALEASLAAGKYDEIVEPAAFADRLTADLQAIAHDKHMRVAAFGVAPGPPPGAPTGPPPRGEGGVARADKLPGNVGYIEVVSLPPPDVFKDPVDRAMAPLKDTRALILDLRRNGGGAPAAEVYLASYFVDPAKPVAVNKFISRNPGTDTFRTEEFKSSPTPYFYGGKPVYVLTSGSTFSGGEAVAYDLQSLKLAKTVGDVTGGGANPGGMAPISPDFLMFVPMGRPENPTTGKNWEGVGVLPDVAAPAADALKVALGLLGQKTDQTSIDALSQARLFTPRSTPNPASEAAVRRMLDELARGEPNYDLLAPGMQELTRQQLPRLQEMFKSLGPIQSTSFVEVDAQGGDVYDVKFANGSLTTMIALTPDGKTAGMAIRPPGPPPGAAPR
jgi:peptidase S41-like protein